MPRVIRKAAQGLRHGALPPDEQVMSRTDAIDAICCQHNNGANLQTVQTPDNASCTGHSEIIRITHRDCQQAQQISRLQVSCSTLSQRGDITSCFRSVTLCPLLQASKYVGHQLSAVRVIH